MITGEHRTKSPSIITSAVEVSAGVKVGMGHMVAGRSGFLQDWRITGPPRGGISQRLKSPHPFYPGRGLLEVDPGLGKHLVQSWEVGNDRTEDGIREKYTCMCKHAHVHTHIHIFACVYMGSLLMFEF